MASEKITAIVESVKTMTVLELKELVDTICEEFGVSAVAAAARVAHERQEIHHLAGAGNAILGRHLFLSNDIVAATMTGAKQELQRV